ncbi:ABC transporter ATP-binding protein [Anaerocolumna aminovalerica]|uniref:Bacitracin transport system ATP-binding protein n=1 Tax=Anaerocolumna aminovalerica TaxID=1527 RepID=A0A1I5G9H7_9FIRM|nr:ABC transporter ATP-binding protein [Anaerocolumna aminovalerica]MBU5334607.1 ABC transporter ATP-binding protein [Anaerocolumna aminovalerica]SFO32695.1 bacitracin transport system ATP-binding protein [Anaerocolumna aminovalerica]
MQESIIETKDLTKLYGNQRSVDNLNIHVQKGKIYGLLGRNGAGKTTTMRMLLDLLTPTSGHAYLWGKDIRLHKKDILPRVGSLIESPGFYSNLTGSENLEIFATLRKINDKIVIKNAMEFVGLPYHDKKLFSQYSMGMKQRLAIALSIMHSPDLLILDEPTNGLDPIGIAEVRTFIRNLCDKREKTILISSHILSEIEMLADDIGIIDQGKLLDEGSREELQKKRRNFIQLMVSNIDVAKEIIEKEYKTDRFEVVKKNEIRIYEEQLSIPELNKTLVLNNIKVERIYVDEESLEDYFIRVTGGTGIA